MPTGPAMIAYVRMTSRTTFDDEPAVPAGRTAYLAGQCPVDVTGRVVSAEQAVLSEVWDRFQQSALAPAFITASSLLGVAQLGFTG